MFIGATELANVDVPLPGWYPRLAMQATFVEELLAKLDEPANGDVFELD